MDTSHASPKSREADTPSSDAEPASTASPATSAESAPARAAWTLKHKVVSGVTALTSLTSATLFYAGPADLKMTVWMTGTAIMLGLMYVGIFLFRRESLRPWLLIAGGLTSAYFGMFFMMYGSRFGLEFGSPGFLDVLSLANYPLAAIGALIMLSRLHVRTGAHALLETVTLTIAGGLLIWVFVGVRATQSATGSTAATIVAALYPMGNVLLLAILAAVAVRLKERPGGMILLSLGFFGNLAADLISSWQRLEGTYTAGGWVDFGWLLCFMGLSIAPSWPDRGAKLAETLDVDRGQVTPGRLAVLLFALFAGPAILIGQLVSTDDASQTVATIGTVVVFGLALVRIALYNRDLRINERQLVAARDDLEQADHDKQMLLWRLNKAVEEERSRIAAEIHDRPVQRLAAVGYQVEMATIALATDNTEKAAEICDDVADELSNQLTALRRLMVDIRPPVLDERGLSGALNDAGLTFQSEHEGVTVTVTGDDVRLDSETETILYRIAQEALTNIDKHADASHVTIDVAASADQVTMRIADDGRGFDPEQSATFVREGHYGLAGMGERVAMVRGTVDLHSAPGEGTTLTFSVPHTLSSHAAAAAEDKTLATTGAH